MFRNQFDNIRIAPDSQSYNTQKFKKFLASHRLHELEDKSAVLFLGPIGAGKSSAITIQLGGIMHMNAEGKYELIKSDVSTPQTSHGYTSKTLHITPYEDLENELIYLDTAGLNENRGKEEKLWTKNNLRLLFSFIKELRSVVLVMNYGATFGGRGQGFRTLAEELFSVIQGSDVFYDSIVFLVTEGWKRKKKITVDEMISEANKMLEEEKKQFNKIIKELEELYPMSNKLLQLAKTSISMGEKIDIEKIPEKDKADLTIRKATIKLLETFTKSKDKIVLGYPDGEEACRQLRKELIKKIKSTPSIVREQLDNVMKKQVTESLPFINVLSSLASSYFQNISSEAALLDLLSIFYKQHEEMISLIERDWQSVKEHLIKGKERAIKEKRIEKSGLEDQLKQLENSNTEVVLDERHLLKNKSSDLFPWEWVIFGGGWAVDYYRYEGQPFLRYKYSEDYKHCQIEEVINNGREGRISLKCSSHPGCDLNVKIKLIAYEKDLPATKERVVLLRNRIENYEDEFKELNKSLLFLEIVNSSSDLVNEITKEKKGVEEHLKKIMGIFSQPIHELSDDGDNNNEEDKMPEQRQILMERDTVKGLEKLLLLMKKKGVVHPDLSPANIKAIDEFLDCCDRVNKASKDQYVKSFSPKIASVHQDRTLIHSESRAPVRDKGLVSSVKNFGFNIYKKVDLSSPYNFFCKEHQLESGICIALLGYMLWIDSLSHDSQSNGTNLPCVFMISAGIFASISYLRTVLTRKLSDVEAISVANKRALQSWIKDLTTEIEVEAKKNSMTARDLGMFATKRLTEKFNVDVKTDIRTDIRGNLRTLFEVAVARFF